MVSLSEAAALLRRGEAVALPTETVYGLAARIDSEKALKKVFALKRRPLFDPLIVHCRDRRQALQHISGRSALADSLWRRFSPGPLTVAAPKNSRVSPLITAHQPTVAIRIPSHPLMRKILRELPVPLAAPSANMFGKLSPTKAAHALAAFSGKVPVLDGGECQWGLESTIVSLSAPEKKLFILRPGAITKEDLERFLRESHSGFSLIDGARAKGPEAAPLGPGAWPGSQKSHYAPDVPLVIVETEKAGREAEEFLSGALNEILPAAAASPLKSRAAVIKRLSLSRSPLTAARRLYSDLRLLSKSGSGGGSAQNIIIYALKKKAQKGDMWEAIWNRLEKAASKTYKLPAS